MARSVYVTGIDRGDGRQVVDLGVMELLTRQVDRVGVFRPLVHDGPDRLFELLRARYRLSQSPESVHGLDYQEAATVQAEKGTDELVSRLVDRFHRVTRDYEVVLVLGTDFAATQLPDELALNARLANEFGASVIGVVGGKLVLGPKAKRLKLGEKVWLIPGHCDPTVNLHDWYVGVRNGRVEVLWPVTARGAST